MPKKESSNPKSVPTFQAPRSHGKWGWAILCFVVAVLLLFSFIDYRPEQSSEHSTTLTDRNMVGLFGSVVSYYAFTLIGVASWLNLWGAVGVSAIGESYDSGSDSETELLLAAGVVVR